MTTPLIITLDGPAGSGKSTIAQRLAHKLGIEYIDSGAIYRSLALYGQKHLGGVEGYENQIAQHFSLHPQDLEILYHKHTQVMRLLGEDVSSAIRDREITALVRYVANHAGCREIANQRMREAAKVYSVVVDGRDIGTVVFPQSKNKFYLDADARVRAQRRALELNIPTGGPEFEALVQEIIDRDQSDKNREIAPLCQAPDACLINTTGLDIDQVMAEIEKKLMI